MRSNALSVACVQMTSSADIAENLEKAAGYIRQAAAKGAQFIATPENTDHMFLCSREKLASSPSFEKHIGVPFFSDLAKELGITLLVGSMAVKNGDKLSNRSFLFGPDGMNKATYDKVHLFDVTLPTGESHRESDIYERGEKAVCVPLNDEVFTAGLTICYDLRFAYLYRSLAKAGANILCVPAAFTVPTGRAHWEVLLRARAIETGCYVLAPAQVGEHDGGRKTYGHSVIISPWGEVLADAGTEEGIITAQLDIEDVQKARSAINALNHDCEFEF